MKTDTPCLIAVCGLYPAARVVGLLALVVGLAAPAVAGSWQMSGEVGHYLFYGIEAASGSQGGLLQNELRYELAVRGRPWGAGQVLMRWRGALAVSTVQASSVFEPPVSSDALPALDEAYVDVYLPSVDLRLGRQVVAWGTADGFNPTDVVNPRRASLDSLLDREMRRLPVPAVRAAVFGWPNLALTAVGVVDFVPAPLPEDAIRARVVQALPSGVTLADQWLSVQEPPAGSRYELAVRAETSLRGYDLYLSYFHGMEDWPALWLELTGPAIVRVSGLYRRQQHYGLAVAGTLAGATVWAEAAYAVPEVVPPLDGGPAVQPLSDNQPYWQGVAGADYTWGGDLYLSGQLVGLQRRTLLAPYREPGSEAEDGLYALGLLRYNPTPGSTTWEVAALSSLRDGSTLVSPGVAHELRPGLQVTVRYLGVLGDGSSEFGALRPQVEGVGTRLVWSF